MGGILMLLSLVIALFLWMDLTSSFTLILLITTLFLGAVGGVDDYLKMKRKSARGLTTKKKFGLQILFAALLGIYLLIPAVTKSIEADNWFHPPSAKEQIHKEGSINALSQNKTTQEYMGTYFIPFKKGAIFTLSGAGLIIAFLLTLCVVTGSSNAVNLTDGLDGLAAGTVMMVAGVLALFAFFSNNLEFSRYLNILYIEGSGEIAVFLCALLGACLGFLWYNGHPAQVFMGDTGSLALGGILGVAAVLMRREFLLALVGGIFVVEALSVILQVASYKFRNKKRIFLCSPLHHHFEFKGWPETKVVLRFWVVGLILALIGIISLKFQ